MFDFVLSLAQPALSKSISGLESWRQARSRNVAKSRILTLRIAFMLTAVAVVFGGIACWWRPLGEPRLVEHIDSMSQSSMQQFLVGDFRIVREMKALPEPVVEAFTERGGSRLTIANPGERFPATDVISIWDESVPRRRLLFAGISWGKSFVLYERGGIGLSHILALFQLDAASTTPVMWRTYCIPAASLEELRAHIYQGKCSYPSRQS